MTERDYVKPPNAENEERDYVKPPNAENKDREYVKPPNAENENRDYVKPPNAENENRDYVKPPNAENENRDYVKPPREEYEKTAGQGGSGNYNYNTNTGAKKQRNYNYNAKNSAKKQIKMPDLKFLKNYFCTPRVGLIFYMHGFVLVNMFLVAIFIEPHIPQFISILLFIYLLVANYTYSWYIDYQRYIGGNFAKIFNSFSGIKMATAEYEMRKHLPRVSILGDNMVYPRGIREAVYDELSRERSFREHRMSLSGALLMAMCIEMIKSLILTPFALVTPIFHMSTMRKYYAVIDAETRAKKERQRLEF